MVDLEKIKPAEIEKIYADKSKDYYKKFSTNQLRNFFSEIVSIRTYSRGIKSSNKNDQKTFDSIELRLRKLKAMLRYAEAKQPKNNDLSGFREDVTELIDSVVNGQGEFLKKLDNFFTVMEGFVAYHKYYEEVK